ISGLRFWWLTGRFHTLSMESDVTQSADVYRLVTWAHTNRTKLITLTVAVAVVGLGIGLYVWNNNRHETQANEALANLRPPAHAAGTPATPVPADAYAKVASEYAGTSAGGRALLMGAGVLFDAGKYKEAGDEFQKFLQQYPESPWTIQAQLGVAASLEAQGKSADAAAKYKEFTDRYPQNAAIPQAKSALARLYLVQGKPEQALKLYEDLTKGRNNDSWTAEAEIQAAELLAKYPNLKPKPAPAPIAAPTVTPVVPAPIGTSAPAAPKAATGIPPTITNKP
ncbi:MAG: Tetratricopeptide 2 repeat protein, partial [Pedosphaera sp.]|nr:Tetratricopeptide 2 repeat protein [Pedosphaera sp.]